jgi:hypothetical protein
MGNVPSAQRGGEHVTHLPEVDWPDLEITVVHHEYLRKCSFTLASNRLCHRTPP